MASQKGIVTTCDRCGASTFQALLGKNYYDGGYTVTDKFEPFPEGWERAVVRGKYGYLCPECSQAWLEIGTAFLDRVPITIQGKMERITQPSAYLDDRTESGLLDE